MSNAAMTWAWKQALDSGPKFVLVALGDEADDAGICYPKIKRLMEKCRQKERTVQYHLRALAQTGLIRIERRQREDGSQGTNYYQLQMDQAALQLLVEQPVEKRGAKSAPLGAESAGVGAPPCTGTVQPVAPHKRKRLLDPKTITQKRERPPDRPTPPVHHLITYFATQAHARRGITPEIRGGPAGALIKHFLRRYDLRQGRYLVDWFLESDICTRKGPNLQLCFSAGVINEWLATGRAPTPATPVELAELTAPPLPPEQVRELLASLKNIGRLPEARAPTRAAT